VGGGAWALGTANKTKQPFFDTKCDAYVGKLAASLALFLVCDLLSAHLSRPVGHLMLSFYVAVTDSCTENASQGRQTPYSF
jgi:hypothetical protein